VFDQANAQKTEDAFLVIDADEHKKLRVRRSYVRIRRPASCHPKRSIQRV